MNSTRKLKKNLISLMNWPLICSKITIKCFNWGSSKWPLSWSQKFMCILKRIFLETLYMNFYYFTSNGFEFLWCIDEGNNVLVEFVCMLYVCWVRYLENGKLKPFLKNFVHEECIINNKFIHLINIWRTYSISK